MSTPIDVVISDIHSRRAKLIELLLDIGVLAEEHVEVFEGPARTMLVRKPGYRLIQVGDAVSAGYGMDEAEFYEWWVGLLREDDVELVGNHEAPILWPYDDRFKFYGYSMGDMGTGGCDPELKSLVLARQGSYQIAYAVDDWLITHAGCMRRFQRETAQETAHHLNALWFRHLGPHDPHPWDGCPICDNSRGVLWVRDMEKSSAASQPRHIKQVFGHTPTGPTLSRCGTMGNIDTPRLIPPRSSGGYGREEAEAWGGVSALVRREGEWELHYVP